MGCATAPVAASGTCAACTQRVLRPAGLLVSRLARRQLTLSVAMNREGDMWPELLYAPWRDTAATLHLWMQIVGKVRLSLTPGVNHSWQVPLYVSARGLTTSPMPIGAEILELEDFGPDRHRRGRESARTDVQGDLPAVVHPRCQGQPHLADDLHPEVQRRSGVAPRRVEKLRPHVTLTVHSYR